MSGPRPFRFGAQVSRSSSAASWAELARKVEDLGYSTLFVPDHFEDQLAPPVALQAAADATSDLRVGALVFGNDYKHPVVLAKEMASLDVLSGGRVEMGLGAGWMRTDYDKAGIPYDEPGVRVSRMEESLTVIKALMADEACTFEGEHYTIRGLDGLPKPVQRPHPPILIGGGGRRVLGIAGREADIVGINPSLRAGEIGPEAASDATAEATDRKLGWLRDAAGDRFDQIELNCLVMACIVTDDRAPAAEMMAGLFGVDPAGALEVPHALIGSVDEICEDLVARRERWGFSYIVVQGDAFDAMAPVVERLAGT
jgi:probable F420-dependent oxidoreductase